MDGQERNREALIDRFAEQARIIRHRNDRIAEVEARANELALELAHAATRAEKAEEVADARRAEIVRLSQDRNDWEGNALDAEDRAEKAEQERDEARSRLAEAAKEIREQGETIAELAAEEPRPLTPDAITDEMVERARNAPSFDGRLSPTPRLVREMLTAALTEPPSRPEGAEKVEAVLHQYWSGDINGDDLANRIVEEMNR